MPPQRSPDNRGFAGQPGAASDIAGRAGIIPLIRKRSIGQDAVEQQPEVEDRPNTEGYTGHDVRPDLPGQEHVVGVSNRPYVPITKVERNAKTPRMAEGPGRGRWRL